MKKFLIFLFMYSSFFLILCTILRHIQDKPPLTYSLVLKELNDNKITFDIQNDIAEITSAFNDMKDNNSYNQNAVEAIVNFSKSIFYVIRFVIKFIVHSLLAVVNIVILVLRLCGFAINYFTLTESESFDNTENQNSTSTNFSLI